MSIVEQNYQGRPKNGRLERPMDVKLTQNNAMLAVQGVPNLQDVFYANAVETGNAIRRGDGGGLLLLAFGILYYYFEYDG